jgi:ubiquinone/menaquinone biosynthesis C-methylase UbiE
MSQWRKITMEFSQPTAGMSVLDVGCGTGSLLLTFREAGCYVTGIDASPTMLAAARQKLGESVDLRLGNAAGLPFDDGSFDLVTAVYSLHEMPPTTRAATVQEITRVVKPTGKILIIEYKNGPYPSQSGIISKITRAVVEWLAGSDHYKNFRQFINQDGLTPLIEENRLVLLKSWGSEEGTSAIYLLRRPGQ